MCRVALNKFSILISILLVLISFSCSNEQNSGELDFKKLEYNGYIFSEGKVSVFLKNYNKENFEIFLGKFHFCLRVKKCKNKHQILKGICHFDDI